MISELPCDVLQLLIMYKLQHKPDCLVSKQQIHKKTKQTRALRHPVIQSLINSPIVCSVAPPELISASQTRRYATELLVFSLVSHGLLSQSISQLEIYSHPTHTFPLTYHLHPHLHLFRCNLSCSNLANIDRRLYFLRFVHRIHQLSLSAQCLQRLRRLARLGLNSRLRRMAQRRRSRY